MITTSIHTPLSGLDRCDRCGARAKVRAILLSGSELLFCGHHARQHGPKLVEQGTEIYEDAKR